MLNWIWLALVVLAVVIGGANGRLPAVTDQAFEMAKFAVLNVALALLGFWALWLGVMRLAERAGLVQQLACFLRPILRRLFPDVPAGHPAMGAMLMNIAANMLGLSNAATPLGLRAMKDLESLNPHPGTATNAMCTFLAVNTSSVQLIPATAIAILATNQSKNPTAIVGTAFFATLCAAITAVTAVKGLERLPMFRLSAGEEQTGAGVPPAPDRRDADPALDAETQRSPLRWWGKVILALFFAFLVLLFARLGFPASWNAVVRSLLRVFEAMLPDADAAPFLARLLAEPSDKPAFVRLVSAISMLAIPFLLAFFPLYAALRGVKVFEEFVTGAKEGFEVAVRIIPYLVAILVAIGMFRAAGGIELLSNRLSPILQALHFPTELLPLALIRPLSGSGSLGVFTELVKQHGADSLIARTAGTIYGSTETTFYVLAVYFGSVGIKRSRHALAAGLCADFVGIVASVILCRMVFG